MKQDKFYKTSSHGSCGSTVMFWAIDGKGYLSNLDEAHIYTHEEMQSEVNKEYYGGESIPLSVSHVNELATWRVDCQYVSEDDHYPNSIDSNNEYVAIKKQCWDGNDLCFGLYLGESFDYSKANIIDKKMVDLHIGDGANNWFFVPKSKTDEVARRTFQTHNINRRKMIQGAGIVGVRKQRESRSSGKTRWNCPSCGKITWQYNPYDFGGCADISCEEWEPDYSRNYRGE
jgi:hypothetical protein